MVDVSEISDEELAAICKRNRLEEWLHRSGCSIGLFGGFAVSVAIITLRIAGIASWSWFFTGSLAVVSFLFSALLLLSIAGGLARLRCRHYLRELEQRYGRRPLSEYVSDARKSISADEVLFILQGCTVPIYQNWWISVRVNRQHAGNVEVRVGPLLNHADTFGFGTGQNPQECFRIAKGEISASTAARLAEFAGKLQSRKTNLPPQCFDGFPVTCAVLIGATGETKFISCNLAGIPAAMKESPAAMLVNEVFAAGEALIDVPWGFGSTDFGTGEIRIGSL